jgi:hypothetical protein
VRSTPWAAANFCTSGLAAIAVRNIALVTVLTCIAVTVR